MSALDGKWQPLETIRILMGAEMTYRTRNALLEAVRSRAVENLNGSIEAEKDANPFLNGVPAIVEALRCRQIECRVYDRISWDAASPFRKKPRVCCDPANEGGPMGCPMWRSVGGLRLVSIAERGPRRRAGRLRGGCSDLRLPATVCTLRRTNPSKT